MRVRLVDDVCDATRHGVRAREGYSAWTWGMLCVRDENDFTCARGTMYASARHGSHGYEFVCVFRARKVHVL